MGRPTKSKAGLSLRKTLSLLAAWLLAGNLFLVNGLAIGDPKLRSKLEVAESLSRRTYDFSASCPNGIVLMLEDTRINTQNLRLSATQAAMLAEGLYEQSLEDRMEVWCKVAELTKELAASIGRTVNTFDVRDLKLYQGDILLTKRTVDTAVDFDPSPNRLQRTLRPSQSNPDFALLAKGRAGRSKRKVISDTQYFWDTGIIPWKFDDSSLDQKARDTIRAGVVEWESKTCLRFPEEDKPNALFGKPHLRFIKDNGCYSLIGKDPAGQPVSIGNSCDTLGIVTHEIGHAIGLSHEQSRPDRNRYVRINFSNVWRGFEANFFANTWKNFHTEGTPYDYASVMHYAVRDFAQDTTRDTLEPVDPSMRETVGQREGLSFWDVRAANNRYCSKVCGGPSLDWDKCKNHGYRNPNKCSECVCPSGLAPPFCEEPRSDPGCGSVLFSATASPRTFASPNLPVQSHCTYMFKAASNQRIRLKFVNDFYVEDAKRVARPPACGSHVEVRSQNMAVAGPRYCGDTIPADQFVSHGSTIMLVTSNFFDKDNRFQVEYSAESCGGCSGGNIESEQACLTTELKSCDSVSPPQRNLCFDVANDNKHYCCDGYSLTGDMCSRQTPIGPTPPTTTTTTTTTPPPTTTTTTTTTTPPPTTTTTTTTTPPPTTTTTTTPPPTTTTTTTPPPTTTTPPPTTTTPPPTTTTTTTSPPTTTTTMAPPTTATTTTTPPSTTATRSPPGQRLNTTTALPTTTATTTPAPTTTSTTTTTTPTPTTSTAITPTPSSATTTTGATTTTTTVSPIEGLTWTPWTPCVGLCGLCGSQTRRNICTREELANSCLQLLQFRRCQIPGCTGSNTLQCSPSVKVIFVPESNV